jgi:hypothetical protein
MRLDMHCPERLPRRQEVKKFMFLLLLLLAACSTRPTPENTDDGSVCGGAFSDDRAEDGGDDGAEEDAPEASVILERSDVQQFRGTEMVKLLQKMDSKDPDDWRYVRRHVHPAPQPPAEYDDAGQVRRRNFDWPPRADNEGNVELDDKQKAWMSFLLWPEHIRALLLKPGWDAEANRDRLAAYGRMYALLHEFQTRQPSSSPTRESEYWRHFAESMLAYGGDGRELLTANMIVALSNPEEDVVYLAQDILVQIGEPAIEPLCAAMWTSHRQMIAVWEEEVDPRDPTGRLRIRTEGTTTMGNPNYNKYLVDTLYRIGPRVAGYAISELELSLFPEGEYKGKFVGPGWRYRRYFIELLGRLGPVLTATMRADAMKALEAEIDRVIVQEYDEDQLAKGKQVIDESATDDARFVFHEYLIQAFGELGAVEGIRPIIRLWKLDDFHEVAALGALGKITNRRVRSLSDAREIAKTLKVDLKGE